MTVATATYVGLKGETLTDEEWAELLPLVQEAFLKGLSRERALHWLRHRETLKRDLQNYIWEQFDQPHSVRY